MIRNIGVGIDIGSSMTRVVVGEFIKGEKYPNIIGIGESVTYGMRHGYVVSFNDVVNSVKSAVAMAEKTSGIKIKKAFVSIGGTTLRGDISNGSAIVSKADSEVTTLDLNNALADCEGNLSLGNKKILQVFPISYKLDGKELTGRIEGSIGNKLEVKALFATCSAIHFEDLLGVLAEAGIEAIDVVASPIAGSHIALSKKQKIVGGALVNIGAETVSMAVFENDTLISLHSFSIGGGDITNDIALGLKVTLDEAESFKLGNNIGNFPKKKIDEIIDARLSDIFELIENYFKKIKRNELLPAGIVWIGGGANISNLAELSKNFLKLPSKVGSTEMFGNTKTKLKDSCWFTALGLLIDAKENTTYREGKSTFSNLFKDIKIAIRSSIKQLMP